MSERTCLHCGKTFEKTPTYGGMIGLFDVETRVVYAGAELCKECLDKAKRYLYSTRTSNFM